MKKYVIVQKDDFDLLEKEVTERLNEGWICVGGLVKDTISSTSKDYFLQAMIHEDWA